MQSITKTECNVLKKVSRPAHLFFLLLDLCFLRDDFPRLLFFLELFFFRSGDGLGDDCKAIEEEK